MEFYSPKMNFILMSIGGKGVSVFKWMVSLSPLEHNGKPWGNLPEGVDYLHLV